MSTLELQQSALANARGSQSMMNYAAIFSGFADKGIDQADIVPRVNVLTFNAWLALGRVVRKGEHGVHVVTFVPMSKRDGETCEVKKIGRRPRTTTVFHVSQTDEVTS